jgi:hypothetical protein
MPKTVIGLEVNMNSSGAEGSVKSLKAQLREAQADVASLSDKFGLTSEQAQKAAKRAAELKDAIGDAKLLTDAFNPDAKFKSFSNAISGVVGGFSALQGAQALFGDQSEELTKTLAKVQGAMALSQGVNSVLEAKDAFKVLGGVIRTNVVAAFSTLKGAIISTGIGALVVALGLVINYFMEMSSAADKAAESQKKLNEETKRYADEGLKAETSYLERTQKLEIAKLKNKGATEKEIFDTEQQYRQLKINSLQRHYDEIKGADAKAADETLNQIKSLQTEIKIAELDFDTAHQKKKEEKKQVEKVESEQLKKARESAEMLMLEQIERNYEIEAELRSEAFDEEFLDNADRILMLEDAAKEEEAIAKSTFDLKNELDKQRFNNQVELLTKTSEIFSQFSSIVGKETAAGKALGIASATMDTYIAANKALKADYSVFGPAAQVARFASVAATIGLGIKNIKSIAAVKVPGGGSGNVPSGLSATTAPIGTQMGGTALQQAQINATGNAAVQAFVLESDVSGNQERIERLNRAARIQ